MAIIPDDIKNLDGQEPQRKQNIIYEYIKYMREQIEFWAQNRIKDITNLFTRVDDLDASTAKKSGDTFTGNVKIQANNPNTSQGWSNLTVGSDKPTGTAQNSRGQIYIYGNGSNYTIVRAPYSTADRQCDFPDATGTIALNENTFKYKGFLPTTTDLNTLIGVDNVGVFTLQGSAVNAPNVAWCSLYCNVPDWGQQMIVTATGVWTRSRSGNPRQWSAWYYTSTYNATGNFTPASGFSVVVSSEVRIAQRGHIVEVHVNLHKSSAFGSSPVTVGNFAGVTYPPKIIRTGTFTGTEAWNTFNAAYLYVSTGGELIVTAGKTTDTNVNIDLIYTLD